MILQNFLLEIKLNCLTVRLFYSKLVGMNLFNLTFIILIISSFLSAETPRTKTVLVSVAPFECFVKKIAGDTLNVVTMVPAGASSHTYEPTPKQTITASQADVWFTLGEPFEKRALKAIQEHHPDFITVDLNRGLPLIQCTPHVHADGSHCSASGFDPHIWLSTRMAITESQTIASALTKIYPEHAPLFLQNLQNWIAELQNLDKEIQRTLEYTSQRNILVSHPAYAYFCRDYNLRQYSIEFEGKDPAPQQLTRLLSLARQLDIKTVFIQSQYSNKGALLVAKQLGANVVSLDPYSGDYVPMMKEIATQFAKQ